MPRHYYEISRKNQPKREKFLCTLREIFKPPAFCCLDSSQATPDAGRIWERWRLAGVLCWSSRFSVPLGTS
jgi:hypothetical protein